MSLDYIALYPKLDRFVENMISYFLFSRLGFYKCAL